MTLAVRDLAFAHPGAPRLLDGVAFEVPRGRSAFVLGASGAGKTTLLRCIAGLETGYTGSVLWDGAPLDAVPAHARRIGFLFQEPALFPHLDVERNVRFGMRYRGLARRDEPEEARRLLALVGLEDKGRRGVDALSGGERQRVALARALAAAPRAVLLDEPLSALDRDLRVSLGERVKKLLAREGVAAIWVTHDADEAKRLADATWRLEAGRLA
ncbi:MAG TPA: ATP-binding cassette domain-containing protein [Candidatus Thermoplasmatota archaeon]|nr:ATP-binding cassette domain-containing protein [Candidatus Thermoplasmatota archaeon]